MKTCKHSLLPNSVDVILKDVFNDDGEVVIKKVVYEIDPDSDIEYLLMSYEDEDEEDEEDGQVLFDFTNCKVYGVPEYGYRGDLVYEAVAVNSKTKEVFLLDIVSEGRGYKMRPCK